MSTKPEALSVGLDALVGRAVAGAVWCSAARECELTDDECRAFGCRRFADRETIVARVMAQSLGQHVRDALVSEAGKKALHDAISARLAKRPNAIVTGLAPEGD